MKCRILLGSGALIGILVGWVALVVLATWVVDSRVPVDLPSMHIQSIGDYVFASGTWVIEGERQAFPLQTTEIQCDKQLRKCSAATAMVGFGDQLHVNLSSHDVIQWSASQVVFADNSPTCVSYIYTIDLLTKSANAVRRKRTQVDSREACVGFEEEFRLSLKDGFSVANTLQEEAMPWFGALVLSPLKLFN